MSPRWPTLESNPDTQHGKRQPVSQKLHPEGSAPGGPKAMPTAQHQQPGGACTRGKRDSPLGQKNRDNLTPARDSLWLPRAEALGSALRPRGESECGPPKLALTRSA